MTLQEIRTQIRAALVDCAYPNDGSIEARTHNQIQWAWAHWEDSLLAKYYEGEKPAFYPPLFRDEWIETEDFEEYLNA